MINVDFRCLLMTKPASGAELCGLLMISDFFWGLLRVCEIFCPKNRFWAVICMGTETPSDKRPLAAIEALAREKPTQLIAQLRAIWPQAGRSNSSMMTFSIGIITEPL